MSFVHLHTHSQYSLLDGASRISEIVRRAKELGMPAVAITDHGSMYGAIEFYKQAKANSIKPIIGCELYIAPRSRREKSAVEGEAYYHLLLLAQNNQGYRNLLELVSRAYSEGFYYKPRIDRELLAEYSEGLICLSACIAGEIPAQFLKDDDVGAERLAREYLDIFGPERFFLELQDHGIPEQRKVNKKLVILAKKIGAGIVATNDIHYVAKSDAECHDVLLCIQTGKTVNEEGRMRFPTNEFYLKSESEMNLLFEEWPEALANTLKIAEKCNVDIEFGKLHLPEFPVPEGLTANAYLRQLCFERLPVRYADDTTAAEARLDYELGVIRSMGFSSYFLIVWDFVNYARSQKIPVGPGRGSAAGSIVAYLLGITNIDPLRYGLLFERFLNPERVTMPDIDIDFCYERRGQIIEYVARRYGQDHVAQIITFGTMAAKAAVRDVGRALNMAYGEVDRIAKLIPNELGITLRRALEANKELNELYQADESVQKLINLAIAVEGLPRHASTHAAGLVIAKERLTQYVPLQTGTEGFLTTQYDKDRVEEIGLLKMDLLGLRTLTVIGDALELLRQSRGLELNIDDIPLADPDTAQILANGETLGIFQMESAGITNLVKELKPECFEDLIPLVALYRPGPLGSGMVTDFIDGRHGRKVITYAHALLKPILEDTFGVILYQEQVMQVASAMAGFTLGQADLLRRAMGKKKHDVLAAQRDTFLRGAAERGIDGKLAAETFDLLAHFADYGFNKSHSAAYALVAYQTAYLKAHYPQEFMAALLTSVMGTNDKVSLYIEECRRLGVAVLPPDINASGLAFTVDQQAIRFGLAGVKNVGEGAIDNIVSARFRGGKFTSLVDFCTRVDMRLVNKRVIESLIKCGAFDSLGWKRAQLLAVLERAVEAAASKQKDIAAGQIGLFGDAMDSEIGDLVPPAIDELPKEQLLAMEKEITGFYVTGHPLDAFRDKLAACTSIDKLTEIRQDGQQVKIGGLVASTKRITTKSGDMMCFLVIEDFTGQVEVVVFPRVFAKSMRNLVPEAAVMVTGRISVGDDAVKVIADDIAPLAAVGREVRIKLTKDRETGLTIDKLKRIFTEHHGDAAVYLHLVESNRVIKTEKQFWLEPTPAAIIAIEKILGPGTVAVT